MHTCKVQLTPLCIGSYRGGGGGVTGVSPLLCQKDLPRLGWDIEHLRHPHPVQSTAVCWLGRFGLPSGAFKVCQVLEVVYRQGVGSMPGQVSTCPPLCGLDLQIPSLCEFLSGQISIHNLGEFWGI